MAFIFAIIYYFSAIVNPLVIEISEIRIQALTNKIIGGAVYKVIKDNASYDSLINITRNGDGDVVLMHANSLQINMLAREISREAQTNIDTMGDHGVEIPLGVFSGIPILAGFGPDINIKLVPIGAISSNFSSEFKSVGINQTLHRIFLHIQANVNIILPTITHHTVSTSTEILVCESIIVGKIPEVYLNSPNIEDMLDLIPR